MTVNRVRYRPRPLRQKMTYQGKLIGCTDTSFAMGCDAATLKALIVTEAVVRGLSTEARPDPSSPGLNLDQLDAVARKLRVDFTNHTGDSWDQLTNELDHNAAVVAQLWYGDIPGGNDIGHAFYLSQLVDGQVKGVDPITGKWGSWPAATVQKAMISFARRTGLAQGLRWGAFRRAPWISTDQRPQHQP